MVATLHAYNSLMIARAVILSMPCMLHPSLQVEARVQAPAGARAGARKEARRESAFIALLARGTGMGGGSGDKDAAAAPEDSEADEGLRDKGLVEPPPVGGEVLGKRTRRPSTWRQS